MAACVARKWLTQAQRCVGPRFTARAGSHRATSPVPSWHHDLVGVLIGWRATNTASDLLTDLNKASQDCQLMANNHANNHKNKCQHKRWINNDRRHSVSLLQIVFQCLQKRCRLGVANKLLVIFSTKLACQLFWVPAAQHKSPSYGHMIKGISQAGMWELIRLLLPVETGGRIIPPQGRLHDYSDELVRMLSTR